MKRLIVTSWVWKGVDITKFDNTVRRLGTGDERLRFFAWKYGLYCTRCHAVETLKPCPHCGGVEYHIGTSTGSVGLFCTECGHGFTAHLCGCGWKDEHISFVNVVTRTVPGHLLVPIERLAAWVRALPARSKRALPAVRSWIEDWAGAVFAYLFNHKEMSRELRYQKATKRALNGTARPRDIQLLVDHQLAAAFSNNPVTIACLSRYSETSIDLLVAADNNKGSSSLVHTLRRIGTPQCVDYLVRFLSHQNPSTRATAALALGKTKDRSAVEALCDALDDEDSSVKKAASVALGEIGDVSARKPLIEALTRVPRSERDRDPIAKEIRNALRKIGNP